MKSGNKLKGQEHESNDPQNFSKDLIFLSLILSSWQHQIPNLTFTSAENFKFLITHHPAVGSF